MSLGDQAVTLLQELIRFNTANLPGNEGPEQAHIAAIASGNGSS